MAQQQQQHQPPQQQQPHAAEGQGWYVEVTEQPLDLLRLTQLVTHPEAGAISTFIGTTRNNFDNKAVLYLEYEAYVPMAVAKLKVRPVRLHCDLTVCRQDSCQGAHTTCWWCWGAGCRSCAWPCTRSGR